MHLVFSCCHVLANFQLGLSSYNSVDTMMCLLEPLLDLVLYYSVLCFMVLQHGIFQLLNKSIQENGADSVDEPLRTVYINWQLIFN
jgi:hypothetical protein